MNSMFSTKQHNMIITQYTIQSVFILTCLEFTSSKIFNYKHSHTKYQSFIISHNILTTIPNRSASFAVCLTVRGAIGSSLTVTLELSLVLSSIHEVRHDIYCIVGFFEVLKFRECLSFSFFMIL